MPPPGAEDAPSGGAADDREPEGAAGERHPAGEEAHRRATDAPLRSEALPETAPCPFCGGEETEQFAAFGSAVSTSQYYCRACRSVFEYMKWRER